MTHTWMDAVSFAAREAYGLPATWEGAIFTKVGMPQGRSFGLMVRGAVSPPYTRGPRKGEPNWPKRDKATECEVYVSHEQVSAAQARLLEIEQGSAAA